MHTIPTHVARLFDYSHTDAHQTAMNSTLSERDSRTGLAGDRPARDVNVTSAAARAWRSRIEINTSRQKGIMNKLTIIALTATALSVAAMTSTATAVAVPSGPSSVEQTVNQLKADGYTVIVNKVGASPAGQCTIASVRPGQIYSRTDTGTPGAQDDIHTTVTGKTVFVDVTC
jgi:hypothetical protein